METKVHSTKDQILHLLKIKGQMTITELANELNVTEMAVRRHISKLEKELLVEATLVRQSIGRPMYVYRLSISGEDLFPKRYKEFAVSALQYLQQTKQEALIAELFKSYTETMKQQLEKRLQTKETTAAKMMEIANAQKQFGFMAELHTDGDNTFELKKFNCPLLCVAKEFPSLCQCELQMYKELLQTEKVSLGCSMNDGETACIFKMEA